MIGNIRLLVFESWGACLRRVGDLAEFKARINRDEYTVKGEWDDFCRLAHGDAVQAVLKEKEISFDGFGFSYAEVELSEDMENILVMCTPGSAYVLVGVLRTMSAEAK